MKKILLVIDMQKGCINPQLGYLGQRIRGYITKSGSIYDKIIFTQFVNEGNRNFEDRLGFCGMRCGEPIEIVDELADLVETLYRKNTYSALKIEPLRELILETPDVEVDICGVDTDACILATAFEAFDLGLKFSLLDGLVDTGATYRNMGLETLINRNIGWD